MLGGSVIANSIRSATALLWSILLCRIHTRLNLADEPSRITRNDGKIRHALCDDAASANNAAPSNRDPWQYTHVPTDPAILSNMDLLTELWSLCTVTKGRIKRMGARVEATVRADKSAGTDGDETGVQENGIKVHKDILTKPYVVTVVHG